MYSTDVYHRPILETPNLEKDVLLHSCCAPCSGEVMEAIKASGINQTVFFYNPNIHPEEEYLMRKNAVMKIRDIVKNSASSLSTVIMILIIGSIE